MTDCAALIGPGYTVSIRFSTPIESQVPFTVRNCIRLREMMIHEFKLNTIAPPMTSGGSISIVPRAPEERYLKVKQRSASACCTSNTMAAYRSEGAR